MCRRPPPTTDHPAQPPDTSRRRALRAGRPVRTGRCRRGYANARDGSRVGLGFVEMVGAGAMLNADGLLPPGRIRVTVDQVKVMFVDAFPDSATRPALYQAWVRHRQAVEAVVPIVAQVGERELRHLEGGSR